MNTFKFRLLSLILAMLGFVQASSASAAVTSNSTIPFDLPIFVPCANNGIGEMVYITGNLHILSLVTISNANSITIKNHFQPQGLSGVGAITGDKYRATGVTQDSTHVDGIDGFPFVFSYVNNFRIIGQGPNNNFVVHENVHLTVNANGATTASVDNFSIDCK